MAAPSTGGAAGAPRIADRAAGGRRCACARRGSQVAGRSDRASSRLLRRVAAIKAGRGDARRAGRSVPRRRDADVMAILGIAWPRPADVPALAVAE
jgi:hypothetical protein